MNWRRLVWGPVEQDAAVLIHTSGVIGIEQDHKWCLQSFGAVNGHHAYAFIAIRIRKRIVVP